MLEEHLEDIKDFKKKCVQNINLFVSENTKKNLVAKYELRYTIHMDSWKL